MAHHPSILAEQFDDLNQQHQAAELGLWTFLATEVLFFGGLFLSYIIYRFLYFPAFALGSQHSNIALGTLNTAILLTSSLTMALAVHAAQSNASKAAARNLLITAGFGVVFLGIKAIEYYQHFQEHLVPGASFNQALPSRSELFFWLYFVMTGLHALHVLIGIAIIGTLAVKARRGRYSNAYFTPVELGGLYWHFVDIVWIFLYPLFYLVNRHAS